jgi:mevalonate kinase
MGYGCPPRSGVGGSGTLGVALARAQELTGGGNLSREKWFRINAIANEFATALSNSDWVKNSKPPVMT